MAKEMFTFEIELNDGTTTENYQVEGLCSSSGVMPVDFELAGLKNFATGEALDIQSLDPQWIELIKEEAIEEAERLELFTSTIVDDERDLV